MRHRVDRLLPLLALAAAGLAAEPADELERARALQLAHQPREAIALYRPLIEAHRFALAQSVPALVGLVDCYQMLAADPAAAPEYAALAAKLLEHPPELDGAAHLDPKTAREDLLWKPWSADATTPLTIALTGSRHSLTRERDEPVRHLQLTVTAEAGDGLAFTATPPGAAGTTGPKAEITIGERKLPAVASVSCYGKAMISFQVDGMPAGVEQIDRLEATVPLTAVIGRTLEEKPLRAGERWDADGIAYRIASFTATADGGHQLVLDTAAKRAGGGAGMAVGAAMSSASAGGDGDSGLWLKTASGGRLGSTSLSSSSGNGKGESTLTFPAGDEPVALVVCTGTETSTHAVRIVMTDLAVP